MARALLCLLSNKYDEAVHVHMWNLIMLYGRIIIYAELRCVFLASLQWNESQDRMTEQ